MMMNFAANVEERAASILAPHAKEGTTTVESPFSRRLLEEFFERADIRLDGGRPWDIEVRDANFFARVVRNASLGFGESYMDGDWECVRIDEMVARCLRHDLFEAMFDRRMIYSCAYWRGASTLDEA